MSIRRNRRTADLFLIISVLFLIAFGLLSIYSATQGEQSEDISNNFKRQVIWVAVSLVVGFIITLLPIGFFKQSAYIYYSFCLLLLLIVLILKGPLSSDRWLAIGGISVQPSEFTKLGLILALARYLGEQGHSPNKLRSLAVVFAITLAPFLMVVQQPDLTTAIIFLISSVFILFWAGLDGFLLFLFASPIIVLFSAFNFYTFTVVMVLISFVVYLFRRGKWVFWSVFLVNVFVGALAPALWSQLRPYQQQRVLTFLGLISDPQGVGYQIIQSKVAIGSGGLFGKGFMQGTQTQLRFLPAQHTDFVVSVIAEEFGFVVIFLIMIAFLELSLRSVQIAAASKDKFSALVCIGCVSVFVFQLFVNIGMATGILPVAGIPLPFLSYGGSSMLTSMTMVAFIHNVASRR